MPLRKIILLTCISLFLIFITLQAHAGVLYVKPGGTGDGTSWANAFGDPQEAIELAAVDEDYSQVWVAAGTYKPDWHPNGGVSFREFHFSLRNGVAVYGGFSGNESSLAERDFENNLTIFSGDIGEPEDISDNAYHVFYHPEGTDLDETALLDGVGITRGNADGNSPHNTGGGIYNNYNNPTLINVTIYGNEANGGGAGCIILIAAPR